MALLPFEIVSAMIGSLKIDIPWISLNTQPIKTRISELLIVLKHKEITNYKEMVESAKGKENPRFIYTINSSISIQNEMRKFKEIDEKLIKKYIKRLLLNLSIHLQDTKITILINESVYNFVIDDFLTESVTNKRY